MRFLSKRVGAAAVLLMAVPLIVCALTAGPLRADGLPRGAYAQFGSHRFYHGPGLRFAVFSPDGSRIATTAQYGYFSHYPEGQKETYGRTIVLWDAATGERLREVQVPRAPLYCLAFSGDGRRLAAASGSRIRFFDVTTGRRLHELQDIALPRALQFSADGNRLLVTEYLEAVTCVEIATGKRLRRWKPPAGPSKWVRADECVCNFVLAPGGKFIAWQVDKPPDYRKLPPGVIPPPHKSRPTTLLISETATDQLLYRKTFEVGELRSFEFSPDGQRYFVGRDHVTACETATGKALFNLEIACVGAPTISPDGGRAVILSGWSDVRLWDLKTRKPLYDLSPGLVCMYDNHWDFSGDGKRLVVATDSTLRLFATADGREVKVPGHRRPVTPQFSADGRTLVTSCAEEVMRWDPAAKPKDALLGRRLKHAWESLAWGYSADGRYCLERPQGTVRVRETATGRVVSTMEGIRGPHFGLLSSDGARVLLWNWAETLEGIGEGVWLFDARTGKKSGEFKPKRRVGHPLFSPGGRLVAWADEDNAVTLYDAVTGKVVATLQSTKPLPIAQCGDANLLFSPDGEYLIVTTYWHDLFGKRGERDKWYTLQTRVFAVASGREVSRFYANPQTTSNAEKLSCVACAPNNRVLAVAEEESGAIRLIEIASGQVRRQLAGHRDGVSGLAFSPDSQTLASGGVDNVAYLWDLSGTRTGAS
jgi:WD40 repeat protein